MWRRRMWWLQLVGRLPRPLPSAMITGAQTHGWSGGGRDAPSDTILLVRRALLLQFFQQLLGLNIGAVAAAEYYSAAGIAPAEILNDFKCLRQAGDEVFLIERG